MTDQEKRLYGICCAAISLCDSLEGVELPPKARKNLKKLNKLIVENAATNFLKLYPVTQLLQPISEEELKALEPQPPDNPSNMDVFRIKG